MEATTAAVEAPTAVEAASAAHAAAVSTAAAAATSVTATATTTTTTTTTSECRSWLNQADRCQCQQGYNRFSHYAFPPLDEVAPKAYNTFAAGLFERLKSARSKLTVSIGNLIVHHPDEPRRKA
jgi:hypothetical protein